MILILVCNARRNYGFLLFLFLLPAIQVCLYCLALGRTPQGLNVSVYNADSSSANCSSDLSELFPAFGDAPTNMSEIYLANFASSSIRLRYASSIEDGQAQG